MKKDISSDLFNYNRFPGPEFIYQKPYLEAKEQGLLFELLFSTADNFDVVAFNQRYSDFMCQYDYIVGDWGNEQLRLKGFYKSKKHRTNCIDHLDEYIKEYCNFGCHYFVLHNPKPRMVTYQEEQTGSKRRKPHAKNTQFSKTVRQRPQRKKVKSSTAEPSQMREKQTQHFTIRKKG